MRLLPQPSRSSRTGCAAEAKQIATVIARASCVAGTSELDESTFILGQADAEAIKHWKELVTVLGAKLPACIITPSEHDDALLDRFERDLKFFTKQKPPFVEALANIDAGFVAAEMRRHSESEGYFSRAIRSNKDDWGAIAVARWTTEQMIKVNSTNQQQIIVGGVVEFGGNQVSE